MKKILALLLMSMLLLTAASAEQQSRTLVVYYSASGTTQQVAEQIAALTDADVFSLEPVTPYTDEDLNWRDRESRVVKEHEAGENRWSWSALRCQAGRIMMSFISAIPSGGRMLLGYWIPLWKPTTSPARWWSPSAPLRPPATARAARTWLKRLAPASGSKAEISSALRRNRKSPNG